MYINSWIFYPELCALFLLMSLVNASHMATLTVRGREMQSYYLTNRITRIIWSTMLLMATLRTEIYLNILRNVLSFHTPAKFTYMLVFLFKMWFRYVFLKRDLFTSSTEYERYYREYFTFLKWLGTTFI